MCGICGIVKFDGNAVSEKIVKKMNDLLTHRGPDQNGTYFKTGRGFSVGFGHSRLSIIDLQTGVQPMQSVDGSVCVVFNGEIYNYLELRKILIQKGYMFKTKSDTEVIIYSYKEWGDECVNRFRGMFAFAIWDERKERLLLARDRVGIKPLYFWTEGKKLIFASELKSILAYPEVKKHLDPSSISDFFSLLYIPAPKTVFKNIQKLLPGHTLVFSKKGIHKSRYWDLRFSIEPKKTDELIEKLLSLLRESVELRLVSDVPLGAFLSGGVDSSSVVAMMSSLKKRVVTNSIGFEERSFNELPYAKVVADLFECDHNQAVVKPDLVNMIEDLTFYFDEPFGDSSFIPTYCVSKMARERVKVALSGDGGDENFAGYRRYFYHVLESFLRRAFPSLLKRTVVKSLARIYPKADWLPRTLRAKTLLRNLSLSDSEAYFYSVSQILPEEKRALFTDSFKDRLKGYRSFFLFEELFSRCRSMGMDALSSAQYVDIKTYLVDDILTKVDRASMANSLEVRVPLLDHRLMEFIATIPSHLKLKGRSSKFLFKKALLRYLPEKILFRKKKGFEVPVSSWLKKEIKENVKNTILSSSARERGVFNYKTVEKIWNEHQRSISNNSSTIWALFVFEKWCERWMD